LWPCKNCGHNNPDEAITCENCGALMDEIGDSGDNKDSEDLSLIMKGFNVPEFGLRLNTRSIR
jgi:hypothetical protein